MSSVLGSSSWDSEKLELVIGISNPDIWSLMIDHQAQKTLWGLGHLGSQDLKTRIGGGSRI